MASDNRDEITTLLGQEKWGDDAVQAVLASKALKRRKAGRYLHAYALDVSPRSGKNEAFNIDNVNKFIDSSYEYVKKLGKPQRFQLMVKTSDVHWTAVDLIVTPANGIKMLNIDPGLDLSAVVAITNLFDNYVKKYPTEQSSSSALFYLSASKLPHNPEKEKRIQYDEDNCSVFALDAIFHLANINPFLLLEADKEKFYSPSGMTNVFRFTDENIPIELASIYRNTQSKTSFSALSKELRSHTINKKGEKLADSEKRHTEVIDKKPVNRAIYHKKDGFRQDVGECLCSDGFVEEVAQREALAALESGTFLSTPSIDPIEIVTYIIQKAKELEKIRTAHKNITRFFSHRSNINLIHKAEKELHGGDPKTAISILERLDGLSPVFMASLITARENIQEMSVSTTAKVK